MKLEIKFDDLAFRSALKDAVTQMKADGPLLVKEETRLFITEYMKMTPPYQTFGGPMSKSSFESNKDYQIGVGAITDDLKIIATGANRDYVNHIRDTYGDTHIRQQLFKKGTSQPYFIEWDKISIDIEELRAFHRKKMNKYGRQSNFFKGGKKAGGTAERTIGRWVANNKLVMPFEVIHEYKKMLCKKIGSAKGSFSKAMTMLKGKQPWYISRHQYGGYSEQGDATNFNIVLSGKSVIPQAQKVVDMAIAIRAKKFSAEMKRIMSTFARTGKIATKRKSFNT
jgi:hypothetical protein